MSGFHLLPVSQSQMKQGVCPECAVKHPPAEPHNAQSLFYQYKFRSEEGRWPTWKDAVSHCTPEIRAHWERELRRMNAWSEPSTEAPDVLPTDDRSIGTTQSFPIDAGSEDCANEPGNLCPRCGSTDPTREGPGDAEPS